MGMLASKNRQSISSVDLLPIFYVVRLWACPFFRRGAGERMTEGSTSGLESGVLTQ